MTGTKERIVEATLETLREDGFAAASARTIARRGGFNQALIFYHFGTLDDVLLAALDRTSERRMARYRAALDGDRPPGDLLRIATELYREDLDCGHITVLTEMIAGSSSRPDLGRRVLDRMRPWLDLTEDAVRQAFEGTPMASIAPPRAVALAIVALYLGVDLITHLGEDTSGADALFVLFGSVAERFLPLLGG